MYAATGIDVVISQEQLGVNSEENVGANHVSSEESPACQNGKFQGLVALPGACECCNFVASSRHGSKREAYVEY
jgi:hypothetical protein